MLQMLTQTHREDLTQEQPVGTHPPGWATLLANIDDVLAEARPRLIRLARLRGVAPDAVEDIVQETFLEAWKHLDRLHSPAGISAWIDEICRNICRRYERKHATDMQHSVPFNDPHQHNDEDTYENTSSPTTDIADPQVLDIAEALSHEDVAVLLDRAMSTLPPTTRQLVEMCYLLEIPQREAAARLGLTISALEARLHRARLQLRQLLNGPLHTEAVDLGLHVAQDESTTWSETRLWCSICGQRRLVGRFKPQPDGSIDLHLRCPDCWQHYKLLHTHSMGIVPLADLQSFRPAWKRTMQEETQRIRQAVTHEQHPCPRCGRPAFAQVVRKDEYSTLPPGVPPEAYAAPFQFWVGWSCSYCRNTNICFPKEHLSAEYISADELVFWSHPTTRKFILDHPRRINGPEQLIEYAGQPAIRFQLIDISSAAQLTVIADRFTLQVLAVL